VHSSHDPGSTIPYGPHAARQMAAALRAHAICPPPFAGVSPDAATLLTSACNRMAEIIQAGEGVPEVGMNLRSGASFLLSTLSALRAVAGRRPLSAAHEAWMLAEIECEVGEASALLETRSGRFPAPVPSRPDLPAPKVKQRRTTKEGSA
jgi:hypothetical protein